MQKIQKDIFRDTPVRLIGYANEVGESFRYIAPGFVRASYGIAFAYCIADSYDKSAKMYLSFDKPDCPIKITPQNKKVFATAADVPIW